MKSSLKAVANKIQICVYLGIFSTAAAAQGTGAIVESPAFTPGQASRQGAAAPASGNNDAMSLLLEQIQQLQTEVQALRGFIEEQGFELRKLQRDSLSRYTNMDDRLSALESGAARNPASLSAVTPALPNTVTPAVTGATPVTTPGTISSTAPAPGGSALANTTVESPRNTITPDATDPRSSTSNQLPVSGNLSTPSVAMPTDVSANNTAAPITSTQVASAPIPTTVPSARNSGRGTGTLQPAVLSEQQLYQMAYDSVINSNFDRSIAEFDQYLSIYPQGRFITNAHYWKGQAYLYLNRYEEARAAYEIIINQYGDSPKLPDAMYGLGLAHQGLGNIDQARRLLNDIKRRFPNTGVANLADTRLLSLD